jgi:hypothetical protein
MRRGRHSFSVVLARQPIGGQSFDPKTSKVVMSGEAGEAGVAGDSAIGQHGGSSEWEVRVPRKVLPHEYGQGGRAGSLQDDEQVVFENAVDGVGGGEGGGGRGEGGVLPSRLLDNGVWSRSGRGSVGGSKKWGAEQLGQMGLGVGGDAGEGVESTDGIWVEGDGDWVWMWRMRDTMRKSVRVNNSAVLRRARGEVCTPLPVPYALHPQSDTRHSPVHAHPRRADIHTHTLSHTHTRSLTRVHALSLSYAPGVPLRRAEDGADPFDNERWVYFATFRPSGIDHIASAAVL